MAVTKVNSASANSSGATSITVNKPTDTAEGDLMVAFIGRSANTAPSTVPTDWTLFRADETLSSYYMAIYYKVAGASEGASYQWVWAASARTAGVIVTYGTDDAWESPPLGTYSETTYQTSDTILRAGSITLPENGYVLFAGANYAAIPSTVTFPTGWTEDYDGASSTSRYGVCFAHSTSYKHKGATGNVDATLSSAQSAKQAWLIHMLDGGTYIPDDTLRATAVGVKAETVPETSTERRATALGVMADIWHPAADTRIVTALGLMIECLFIKPPERIMPSKVKHIWLADLTGNRRVFRNAQ
jgi:hypothetical protein